jgi:hypothetical protein
MAGLDPAINVLAVDTRVEPADDVWSVSPNVIPNAFFRGSAISLEPKRFRAFLRCEHLAMTKTVFPPPSLRGALRRSNPVRARRTF